MTPDPPPPFDLLRPRRTITGLSAVLLPFTADGAVDWPSFESLLGRTIEAGLTPAVNMDTGYVNLLDDDTAAAVLDATAAVVGQAGFVAGAFVADRPGDGFDLAAHRRAAARVATRGGTPVLFPCHGLGSLDADGLVAAHEAIAGDLDRFIAFELSEAFAPFGRIWDLDTYARIMAIPACVGAKHSSLRRQAEWDRLRLRDERRPDFRVFTGNDLAIDMVMYGSDYLLGLSAFAPDAFAARDRAWAAGDPSFHEHNDVLQYLGAFAFRQPVPAYKHSAAQFLALRGWIACADPHPDAPRRPDSDVAVLAGILDRLEALG